jgi:zinc transporter ZupT
MVLSGIICPFAVEMIALAFMGEEAETHTEVHGLEMAAKGAEAETRTEVHGLEMVAKGAQSASSSKPTSAGSTKTAKPVARILAGILIGDFCHNFVDGVLIGSAFLGCGNATGWTVATGAISHEIAQEIGDFCLLTGAGNMAVIPALFCNFLSGCSVVLGCAVILSQDVEDFELGMILAFGSGSYIAIGATEGLPRVVASAKSTVHRVAALLSFALGAVVIGVVLTEHEHCQPGGGGEHGH